MWDRKLFAVLGLGVFLSWSYRVALNHLHHDLSGWTAFITIWLPTAIFLGILVAFIVPSLRRWLANIRRKE
jgi:hypothetical protein